MKTIVSFAALSLALITTGCGGGGGGGDEGGNGASSSGGEIPAEYAGPISDTADATAGAEMYDQACASCHADGAPALEGIAWSAAAIRQQVREGNEGMPPMSASRLSDDDLENILAHMATIGGVAN